MFRTLSLLIALISLSAAPGRAAPAAAADAPVVAVLDFKSGLEAEGSRQIDAAALADLVRAIARGAVPKAAIITREETRTATLDAETAKACGQDCDVSMARELSADVVVGGSLFRMGQGYRVALELHSVIDNKLIGRTSASGVTPEELAASLARAAIEVFKPLQAGSAPVALGPAALPELPLPASTPKRPGAVDLDDADLLVAVDNARTVDARGQAQPDEAASAWRAVAEFGPGPYKSLAESRARQWQVYAASKRAYDAQRTSDEDRLRKLLPLQWIDGAVKTELLVRHARVYGAEHAMPFLKLLADAATRDRASAALGCEARDAGKCVLLARYAEADKDPAAALGHLDKACDYGSGDACLEAGERFLREPNRDVAHATAALDRGCNLKKAASCVRLARLYEEGDGVKFDRAVASVLRDQACNAGDGKSCRRLACLADETGPRNEARISELWRKGCAAGDADSCVFSGSVLRTNPTAARTGPLLTPERPARSQSELAAAAARTERNRSIGVGLLTLGAATVAGVVLVSANELHGDRDGRYRHDYRGSSMARMWPLNPLATLLGAAGVISASAGIAMLLGGGEPAVVPPPATTAPKTAVSISPNGVMLSGTLP